MLGLLTLPISNILHAADNFVRRSISFSAEDFEFSHAGGYDVVLLVHGGCLAETGRPMLPSTEVDLPLPDGMRATDIRVEILDRDTLDGNFNITPTQPPRTIGTTISESEWSARDLSVYASSAPYPESIARLRCDIENNSSNFARVSIYPLQYIPARKQLVINKTIAIDVRYEANVTPSLMGAISSLPEGSYDHVVVTTPSLSYAFSPLIDWHIRRGLADTLIDVGWIAAHYSGSTPAEKLRSFVVDAASNWNTKYFLLGGVAPALPIEYRQYADELSPSDQYYSDFDDDWVNEVYVGRIPATTAAEVTTFVNKLLKYEKDPPRDNYVKNTTLIGMDLDDFTRCEELEDAVRESLSPDLIVTTIYDSQYGDHKIATLDALNSGQHLVNHADHSNSSFLGTGYYHHNLRVSDVDINGVDNDNYLSIVVSTGCLPIRFDGGDCIARNLVTSNPNRGAVAFVGNSGSGFYYQGNVYSLTNALDLNWWDALFSYDTYILGEAVAAAKHATSNESSMEKQCEWNFNLVGDPSMPIWTDVPDSFAVLAPDSIGTELTYMGILVLDPNSYQGIADARVTLYKKKDFYQKATTDANGNVAFYVNPSYGGVMYLTVTKRNYRPMEKYILVGGLSCGDVDANGMTDIDDVVFLLSYIFTGGTAPVSISDADPDCSGAVDVDDVLHLLAYIFTGGPQPCADCP